VLASAAIFALVHPAPSVIPVFGLGIATALVYERTGFLFGPMVVHAVYNAAVKDLHEAKVAMESVFAKTKFSKPIYEKAARNLVENGGGVFSHAVGMAVHDDGAHWMQTGYPLLNARARGQTHPAEGTVVSRLKGAKAPGMPAYVCIPEDYRSHMGFYQTAAYLGARYNALNAGGDPSLGNYRPPEFRFPKRSRRPLDDRKNLLSSLDRFAAHADAVQQWGSSTTPSEGHRACQRRGRERLICLESGDARRMASMLTAKGPSCPPHSGSGGAVRHDQPLREGRRLVGRPPPSSQPQRPAAIRPGLRRPICRGSRTAASPKTSS
jgi:hypothetical protein